MSAPRCEGGLGGCDRPAEVTVPRPSRGPNAADRLCLRHLRLLAEDAAERLRLAEHDHAARNRSEPAWLLDLRREAGEVCALVEAADDGIESVSADDLLGAGDARVGRDPSDA